MDKIDIRLTEMNGNVSDTLSVEMPIGAYTDCQVKETCGTADADGIIGSDDEEETFFLPERLKAQMLWTSAGYVEYKFPNKLRTVPFRTKVTSIAVCMEICSEAAGYQDNWKSDITLWINGKDCGTFTSPGDFGSRRGKNNPPSWGAGRTQYGLLTTWTVTDEGSFVNAAGEPQPPSMTWTFCPGAGSRCGSETGRTPAMSAGSTCLAEHLEMMIRTSCSG